MNNKALIGVCMIIVVVASAQEETPSKCEEGDTRCEFHRREKLCYDHISALYTKIEPKTRGIYRKDCDELCNRIPATITFTRCQSKFRKAGLDTFELFNPELGEALKVCVYLVNPKSPGDICFGASLFTRKIYR